MRKVLEYQKLAEGCKARAAAMAAGLEFLASHRGPKDDDSKGIHH